MQQFNLETAYLTFEDGVLHIRSKGEDTNRIDKVHIVISHQNEVNIRYHNFFYRKNRSVVTYRIYSSNEDDEPRTTYSAEDVLPEYLEEVIYIGREDYGFLGLLSRRVDKKIMLPKEGWIRLNRTPTVHNIKISTPYAIEYLNEKIEGPINTL